MTRWFYRTAAVLLLMFTSGHTYLFLTYQPPPSSGGFLFFGTAMSYRNLYIGAGLVMAIYLAFSAYLAWYLSSYKLPATLRWIFAIVSIAVFALTWRCVGGLPVWPAAIIAALLSGAALTSPKSSAIGNASSLPSQ